MNAPPGRINVRTVDCLVVGAGPAGSYLAFALARQGHDVVLVEKRPEVGVPVRCGEAAGGLDELAHFLPLLDEWIAGPIDGARLFGPAGHCVERRMPGIGTQLHRDRFDQALARQAIGAGAELRTSFHVVGVSEFADGARTVRARDLSRGGETVDIRARVVAGADGVESLVGQWLGLRKPFAIGEVHSGLQYLLDGVDASERYIDLYAGHEVAPGGYAWVFPKDNGTANVGLGIHVTPKDPRPAREWLDAFVQQRFPASRVLNVVAGAVSGAHSLKSLVADGAVLVGEAGHTNNPFSGGGIMNALESAEEAADEVHGALRAGDVGAERLRRYQTRWQRRVGRTNDLFFRLRKLFFTMDDREIDWAVEALQRAVQAVDARDVDYTGIFRTAFTMHPKLVAKATRMLW
jgi:digeranylgeranylglycerophospholipid reductase